MSDKMEYSWRRVIKCAVSNSIDYRMEVPDVSGCDAEKLDRSAVNFICKYKDCDFTDAKKEYQEILAEAKMQKRADGRSPVWVPLVIFVGILASAVNAIGFFISGFNFLFVLFLVISISLVKTGTNQIYALDKAKRAASIWKGCLAVESIDSMENALEQMKKVFDDGKR